MFDGNHRVRRQVNLGSGAGNRRRGRASTRQQTSQGQNNSRNSINSLPAFTAAAESGGRENLLEQTRLLREERRRHQLEEKSALKVQKVYRGWKTRTRIARDELPQLWQDLHSQPQIKNRGSSWLARESFLLSLRLSPPLLQALRKDPTELAMTVDSWLLEHAASVCQSTASNTSTSPYALPFRIVQAALTRLRPFQRSNADILTEDQGQALYTLLQFYLQPQQSPSKLEKRLGGAKGVLLLLQSTQECLWWQAEHPSSTNHEQSLSLTMQQQLWQWSCQAIHELQAQSKINTSTNGTNGNAASLRMQQAGHALLCAVVMGHHTGIKNDPACSWWCQYGNSSLDANHTSSNLYESYFTSLVQHVLQNQQTLSSLTSISTGATEKNNYNFSQENADVATFSQVLTKMLQGRWHIVLSNALDWQQAASAASSSTNHNQRVLPSTALLQFLHHVLTHHGDLAILTSLVVRGDDIKSLVLLQQQQQQRASKTNAEDEDERYLEEEMEEQTAPSVMPTTTNNSNSSGGGVDNENNQSNNSLNKKHKSSSASSSRKLMKQDILTMPQLERIYQEGIQRQTNQTISALLDQTRSNNPVSQAYAQSLVDMATQIGSPALWISWGNMLLAHGDTAATAAPSSDADDATAARHVYIQLLARVLQSATGLRSRTSASSPFLSQLAFAGGGTMIEQLWQSVLARADDDHASSQDVMVCTMLTVFSDVFSHSLIALSDEKFLQQYTNARNNSSVPKKVMAEQVIGYLRNLLHDVYWTKPVIVDDIKLASSGGQTTTTRSDDEASRMMRARFLLSGTKLWVSLYERWCRLVRSTPFCDESIWWFPHLASHEGENAVVNANAQRQGAADGDSEGVESMDIDSSEEEEDDEDDDGDHRMENSARDNSQPQAFAVADAESDALASSFKDPKMARVLTCIPQALPFDRRVRLFDSLLTADKLRTQDENAEFRAAMVMMMRGEENPMGSGRERVEIRRDRLYDDSMSQLNQLGGRLKKKVQVAFINQHGTQEAGIDGGGVFKEFVDDLIKDAFSIESNSESNAPRLFSVTPLQTLTVNSSLTQNGEMLAHYEFLGRVLGKAVYESILVEPQFCLPFLNQLLGKRNSLEDLKNFDIEYYNNLTKLLDLKEDEIENLGLSFEITLGEGQSMRTVELLPGGRMKQVTKMNVIQYIHLVAHQRLNVEGAVQTKSFLRGFRDLIPASWVRLFSANELQKLISGDDSLRGFDVESLKRAMKYAAGCKCFGEISDMIVSSLFSSSAFTFSTSFVYNTTDHPSQPVMEWFWEVIEEFTPEQQRKFLKFMTSCSRQPLLGFSSLEPPPCVQQIRLPDDLFEERDMSLAMKNAPLPTSSTCMNLLKLPNYRNKELLKKKLLDAIESGAGFELT